jgi:hypothetical protein
MSKRFIYRSFALVHSASLILAGCGGTDLSDAHTLSANAPNEVTTQRKAGGSGNGGCPGVPRGQTLVRATVEVEARDFLKNGHEHVRARITSITSASDKSVITTPEVELAMRFASSGLGGLPSELPLAPGETLEVEGVYVPKEQAYGTNHKWAVIHFTHAPCGFVAKDGNTYR